MWVTSKNMCLYLASDSYFHIKCFSTFVVYKLKNNFLTHVYSNLICSTIKKCMVKGPSGKTAGISEIFGNIPSQGVSIAVDARLEQGVESVAEMRLKTWSVLDTDSVLSALQDPLPPISPESSAASSRESPERHLPEPSPSCSISSVKMLGSVFNELFTLELVGHCVDVDALLKLWYTLCIEDNADMTQPPVIALSRQSTAGLMSCLLQNSSLSVQTWSLAFQVLALLANQKLEEADESGSTSMASHIIADVNFVPLLLHFLSGTHSTAHVSAENQVGFTHTQNYLTCCCS